MKKKPGFKIKLTNEQILYVVIIAVVFGFTFFMPKMYKFFGDLKNGNLFKNNIEENNKNNENNNNNNENNNNVELNGDKVLLCTLNTSTAENNLTETYTFYYTNNSLKGLKHQLDYDAMTDDYLNYLYLQQSKYNSLNDLYKNVAGFNYTSTFDASTFKATFTYNLVQLNPEDLKNEDENLSINLNVQKDQNLEEVKTLYTGLGYTCK